MNETELSAEDSLQESQYNWECIIGLATFFCLLLWAAPYVCKLHHRFCYLQYAASQPSHSCLWSCIQYNPSYWTAVSSAIHATTLLSCSVQADHLYNTLSDQSTNRITSICCLRIKVWTLASASEAALPLMSLCGLAVLCMP